MSQNTNKKGVNRKTSQKAVGVCLFVSVFTVTNVQADSKQDIAELEAFYEQVFGNKEKPSKKKAGTKDLLNRKDPDLVAFYNHVFANDDKFVGNKSKSNKVVSNKDPELVAFYEQLYGTKEAKLRVQNSSVIKKLAKIKRTKSISRHAIQKTPEKKSISVNEIISTPIRLQELIDNLSQERVTVAKKKVTKKSEALLRSIQSVNSQGVKLNTPITLKDPELVAFYHQIFSKKDSSQSKNNLPLISSNTDTNKPLENNLQNLIDDLNQSTQIDSGVKISESRMIEKPESIEPIKEQESSEEITSNVPQASIQDTGISEAKRPKVSNEKIKNRPSFKDKELVYNELYQDVSDKNVNKKLTSGPKVLNTIVKTKKTKTVSKPAVVKDKIAKLKNVNASSPEQLQELIDDLAQKKTITIAKKVVKGKNLTPSLDNKGSTFSSQKIDSTAIHTQNVEGTDELPESNNETSSSSSPDLDSLFAKAFGKKAAPTPSKIKVELRLNKEVFGEVTVYSNKLRNKIDKVQTKGILVLLPDIIKEHVFKRVKEDINKYEKVSFRSLKKHGIAATYNSAELSLDLQIDSALRKPSILTFRKRSKGFTREENKLAANDTSAYVNIYSNLGFNSEADPDIKVKLESSINHKGFVLENNTTYINDEWDIGNSRLTYDVPEELKRYVLGDISTGNRNFQQNLQLQGIRISKEFLLDPELQIRPRGNESFILKTDSEVEVYINNRLQQRFYLKEGTYSLQDIGLSHGSNNIRIRIKDEFGKITEKSSLQFYDSHLLKPGLSLYAFSVGILSNEEAYIDEKLKHDPIVSAYYQRGLSKTVTLNLDAQISPKSYLLGSETIASVPIGSIKHSIGFSGGKDKETGFATRFEFKPNIKRELIGLDTLREDLLELDQSIGRFLTGWSISGEYRDKDFTMINEVLIPNEDNNQLRASLETQFGFNLGKSWYGSLGLYASDYYDAKEDLTARLTASKRFNNGVRLSLGAQYDSDDDYSFNMQVSIPLSREKHLRRKDLEFLVNTKDNSYDSKLDIQPLSLIGKNSLSGSLEHRQSDATNQQKLDLTYTDTRFDALLVAQNNSNSSTQQLNIGLNSSLLCVGKNCAVSRPVNDSFALISGPSNQKAPIAIKTGNSVFRYSSNNDTDLPDNYTTLVPKKGSYGVLPLDSYRYQRVNVDEATLPNGYDIEKTEFEVFPRYHQGYLIKAGGEPNVILDGTLSDKDNKPLPFKGGQWVATATKGKSIAFFSNKAGRFRLPSIPAGKYKLELFEYPDMQTIYIDVPDKKGEIYKVGNLVITN